MALKPGTLEDIAGSMAAAMEQVFREELPVVVPGADPGRGEAERRLLFVAVAQGVVRHLAANPDAFKVQVSLTNGAGQVTQIQSM
ncbi:MAG: hypothetical protein H6R23_2158 [Proteobacteria bacterium]|nr:hypothetical protein [Pseudomonadota bacterium]